MKIGHFSFSPRGGAGKVATTLHQYQIEMGLDSNFFFVTLENIAQKPLENPTLTAKAIIDNYLVSRYRNPSIFSFYRSSHHIEKFSKLLDSFDVVHFHWIPGVFNMGKLKFPTRSGIKYFWSVQDMWPFTGGCHFSGGCENFLKSCIKCPQVSFPFQYGVHKKFVARESNLLNIKRYLKIIYPSNFVKNLGIESPMLKDIDFEVIGNPISINYNIVQPELSSHHSEILNSKSLKLCFVAANLSEFRKGARTLIKWFQDNSDNLRDCTLVFVGNNGDFIKQSYNILVIPNLTRIEELNYIYSNIDINISLSKEETFGYTIVEAGLMGTPSVCFTGTAQSELIIDGSSGYLINSLEDLLRIVNSVRSNHFLNGKIGNRARLEFAEKFSKEIIGRRYLDLYKK
jgi:glycosyltransferase involved in cell wall biosynthesis